MRTSTLKYIYVTIQHGFMLRSNGITAPHVYTQTTRTPAPCAKISKICCV